MRKQDLEKQGGCHGCNHFVHHNIGSKSLLQDEENYCQWKTGCEG